MKTRSSIFKAATYRIDDHMMARIEGQIADVVGLTIECDDFNAPVGATCEIHCRLSGHVVEAEVVGFRDSRSILMPLGEMRGFARGDRVVMTKSAQTIAVGPELIGRVIDSRGKPIDGKPAPFCQGRWNVYHPAPDPYTRPVIKQPITTGVRTIDGLLTAGRGQRMGIFAGSGVGKSTLLSMITRNTDADIVVLGLVGERGRELKEFLEHDLGEEGLKRSIVICETSDRPPLQRVKAAFTATAVAEYFRSQGKSVMLLMDSLTRMAMAQREIGLSAGEPPTTRGYPPSVFNLMPRLLERTGATDEGSITAFYTVLVEGDDTNEPIADTVRGILDGHIWLKRSLAQKGHYPAIDVPDSVSRLMSSVATNDHKAAAQRLREAYATYLESEDLINIGAYRPGTNPKIDHAISLHDPIVGFLRQATHDVGDLQSTVAMLKSIVGDADAQQPNAAQASRTPGLRGSAMGSGLQQAVAGQQRGAAPGQQQRFAPNQRTVDPNERIVRPGQQRMPAQQPSAQPGAHPVQAPRR